MGDDVIICRCEEVTAGEILEAIEQGAETIGGIKIRTRAGMGLCQGRTCGRLIARLLAEKTRKSLKEVMPATARPPVRPASVETLAPMDIGVEVFEHE